MSGFPSIAAIVAAAIVLPGCTAMTPPVEVTRFHNAQVAPIVPGSIAVEANVPSEEDRKSLEYATYRAALLRELQRVGFSESRDAGNGSQYIARYTLDRAILSAGGSRSPVSVGVGGSTGSYGSGVGLGIGINLSGPPKDKIATDLSVRISNRADGNVIWEGRASVEAKEGSPASQPGLAAAKLAEALFRDFPGVSGTTIRVP